MYCRNCGNELADGAAMCVKCGFVKGEGTNYCDHCGKPTSEGQAMCTSCGFSLVNSKKGGGGKSDSGLMRTNENKVFGGVCAGLEKYKGVNRYILRIVFVLIGCSGIGIVAYIVACLSIPMDE